MATINGTAGADLLVGTASADRISGLAGNDTLSGGAGNDSILGGEGNDRITGGAGVDYMYGGNGSDTFMFSASQGDSWTAEFGGDTIYDFQGQGGWAATNNDFLNFSGFGPGASLVFTGVSVHNPQLQYYEVLNGASATVFHLAVQMQSGTAKLGAGDYNFY